MLLVADDAMTTARPGALHGITSAVCSFNQMTGCDSHLAGSSGFLIFCGVIRVNLKGLIANTLLSFSSMACSKKRDSACAEKWTRSQTQQMIEETGDGRGRHRLSLRDPQVFHSHIHVTSQ